MSEQEMKTRTKLSLKDIPEICEVYAGYLDDSVTHLSLQHKIIEEALKEQVAWMVFYDDKRRELNKIVKFVELQVNAVKGQLVKKYNENYSRELSERTRDKYIDNEPEYIAVQELLLEVQELCDKFDSVVEAFKLRGFALRDITTLRVHSLHLGAL